MKKILKGLLVVLSSSLILAGCNQTLNSDSLSNSTDSNESSNSNSNSSSVSTTDSSSSSVNTDSLSATEFANILQKDYSNLTYSEDVKMTLTDATSMDSSDIDASYFSIIYQTENMVEYTFSSGSTFEDYFTEYQDDKVRIYTLDEVGSSKYYYEDLTYDEFNSLDSSGYSIYTDYQASCLDPNSFNVSLSDFEYVDGVYSCKASRLRVVGNQMFSSLGFSNYHFTKIELTFEDGYISTLNYDFTASLTGQLSGYLVDASVESFYEDVGVTNVIAPINATERVFDYYGALDNENSIDITPEQKANIDKIFNNNRKYQNYTCLYYAYDLNDEYYILEETRRQGNLYRVDYEDSANNASLYFLEDKGNNYNLYTLTDNFEIYSEELKMSDAQVYLPYSMAPNDFIGISSDHLKYSTDSYGNGGFICDDETIEIINSYLKPTDGKVITAEVYLDDNNEIEEILLINYYRDSTGEYYEACEFIYSDVEKTNISIPTNENISSNLNDDQVSAFNDAITTYNSFSNFTMYDYFLGTVDYVNNKTIDVLLDESSYIEVKNNNDTWYVNANGGAIYFPIDTQDGGAIYFEDLFSILDFTAFDVNDLKWDNFNECYYIEVSNVDLDKFAPTYKDYSFINHINFYLDENNNFQIISWTLLSDSDVYSSSLIFTDYGETSLIS